MARKPKAAEQSVVEEEPQDQDLADPPVAEAVTADAADEVTALSGTDTAVAFELLCAEAKGRLDAMWPGQDPCALRDDAEGMILRILAYVGGPAAAVVAAYTEARRRAGF